METRSEQNPAGLSNRGQRGFTLVELMIVVVILGFLAAISIPNFVAMTGRAKEGATKANMHSFQMSAEDLCLRQDGRYGSVGTVGTLLASNFTNPFDHSVGLGNAYQGAAANKAGIVGYETLTGNVADTSIGYIISGGGLGGNALPLTLSSGQ